MCFVTYLNINLPDMIVRKGNIFFNILNYSLIMKKIIIILNLILLSSQVFAWDILRNKNGALTGYSTPINQDVFRQLNIDPNDKKQRLKSPNVMTDLFSSPKTYQDIDSNNTLKERNGGGVATKTGVTIIYD